MADRETTGTGGPNQNQTGNNPTTKGTSDPMSRTNTTTGTTTNTTTGTQDTVAGMKQNLGRVTGDAADAAMDAGRQTASAAQGRIRSLLEQQTDRAADQLGGVANALHKAAEQLDAENNGAVAQYAVQAADRVERVADMLRHSSLDDIVHEVEGFARRQPEVFIGAAFAVGFLAARFIKSSGERRMHSQVSGTRTSSIGTAHSRAAETAARNVRQTSDYRATSDRAMAGGIADSALRTPRRAGDTTSPLSTGTGTGTGTGSSTLDTGIAGAPKPTIGMPLSRASAPVTGATPSASGTATSATAIGTAAGSTPNTTLGSAPASGTTGGPASSTTVKPQGQRP